MIEGNREAGTKHNLAAVTEEAMQQPTLELGTVRNTQVRSKVVPVGVIGWRARGQPLQLSDRIRAGIRMEEVIWPGTAKYVVVAEWYRVSVVLGVIGSL